MKKLHLICNAHIDPVWQWEWEEGAYTALSTFNSALNLLDEYDYVFCHNESGLYAFVEKHAPKLFKRIQKEVKAGRWRIIGGWHLQPDCLMPSGESLVRQIRAGKRYFTEKFGVFPKTAVNFDPFGHSRGLVQIIKKCGQDAYLFMRPWKSQLKLPDGAFYWEGYDGSVIKAVRAATYGTAFGLAANAVREALESQASLETGIRPWGVGNHGGGPSRKDLEEIGALIRECKDTQIVHSSPDAYFSEAIPAETFSESLIACMPGCYTSLSRLKRAYVKLENALFFTEKIAAVAALSGFIKYPSKEFLTAEEAMLNVQFHDVLPGTCVPKGEEYAFREINGALRILNKIRADAFFALADGQPPARQGCYPVIAFNPQPYGGKRRVACEFHLADVSLYALTRLTVRDAFGKAVFSQVVKEDSNLNCEWRKKVVFEAELLPLALNRFDVEVEYLEGAERPADNKRLENDIVFDDGGKRVVIGKNSGLIESFIYNGREYAAGRLFEPFLLDDNEDPWGMADWQLKGMGTNPVPVPLMRNAGRDGPGAPPDAGIFKNLQSVRIIEDGDIYLGVESLFCADNVKIRAEYKIYKHTPEVDADFFVLFSEADKMLKLSLPLKNAKGYFGQQPYGTEALYQDGRECAAQRFTAADYGGEDCLAVLNDGVFGSSYKDGRIWLSLLRGAVYCAHPILDRLILKENRFSERVDTGTQLFRFRVCPAKRGCLERLAAEFNNPPYALNIFPAGRQKTAKDICVVTVSDPDIAMAAFKKSVEMPDHYVIRLFNNSESPKTATLTAGKTTAAFQLTKYEVKTIIYGADGLKEYGGMIV